MKESLSSAAERLRVGATRVKSIGAWSGYCRTLSILEFHTNSPRRNEITMTKHLQSLAFSKPFMLVLMGVSLGFSLNMLLSSLLNNQCSPLSGYNGKDYSRNKNFIEHYELHYKSKSEVENEAIQKGGHKYQRIIRPRFLSSELDIKDKMVISVLTSKDTLETLGSAINKTMMIPKVDSKLMFFLNGIVKESSNKMHLVMFSEVEKHMAPFLMLKYLGENYLKTHNWFYIFPDTTFVNRERLEDLVNHISVGENLVIGNNFLNNTRMCSFDAGILMSRGVLMTISENIHWCLNNSSKYENHSQNIDQCFKHVLAPLNQTCISQINKLTYRSLNLGEMDDSYFSHDAFISYSNVTSEAQIYRIFRKIAEITRASLDLELSKLISYDEHIVPLTPSKNRSAPWPLGSKMNSQAKNRFDVLRWHYFNGSHVFHDRFEENLKPLKGIDKLDMSDILEEAMHSINNGENSSFALERLINGYRRFDASRGMEYILDLLVSQTKPSPFESQKSIKRIYVVKPLGFPEFVPTPYVNENTQLHLILIVKFDERNDASSFINSFFKICVESGDRSYLLVILVYETKDQQSNDIYASLKSTISYHGKKHQNEKISWISIVTKYPERLVLDAMDVAQKKFAMNSIMLLVQINMEIKIDFLNHVRMNTIMGSQVYFPIGYSSYDPHLVYGKQPQPTSILINQKSGYYASAQYDIASFYLSDFAYAKNQMLSVGAEADFVNLFEMFVRYHSINVFRAVDPGLRTHFKIIKCLDSQEKCLYVKHRSLASRSQLAMFLFEHLGSTNGHQDND